LPRINGQTFRFCHDTGRYLAGLVDHSLQRFPNLPLALV
jgi:hypothetical protein